MSDIQTLRAENERLRAALEVEGLRLAACDVVAMADTPESAIVARQMQPDYRSAALSSVERRVDEVIALRAENERLTRQRDEARAEVARMREALRDIERGDYSDPMCERTPEQRARDALEGTP